MGSLQVSTRRLVKATVLCSGAALAVSGAGGTASGAVVYDSGGFDNTSRFNTNFTNSNESTIIGTLRGQDSATNGGWVYAGQNPVTSGTIAAGFTTVQARVRTGTVQSSPQAIQVDRFNGTSDGRWAILPGAVGLGTASASMKVIQIDWDMNVTAINQTSSVGPFLGIEAYDASGGPANRIAGYGVEGAGGSLVVEALNGTTAGTFQITSGGNPIRPSAGFHHFNLTIDYATNRWAVSLDGVQEANNLAFINAATHFTDADITAAGIPAGNAYNGTATAFFDNYLIQQTPEPGVSALLGAAGLGLGLRRNRRRPSPAEPDGSE